MFKNTTIEIDQIIELFINKNQEIKNMSLDECLNTYLKLRQIDVREFTLRNFKHDLNYVFNFFKMKGVIDIASINQNIVDDYIKFCLYKKNKASTINKRLSNFKIMVNYMSKRNLISKPKIQFISLKEEDPKIKIIPKDDLKKILDNLHKYHLKYQVAILLLISTGIRRNELVQIKTKHIDYLNQQIYLEFTKSGKPRYIYVDKRIVNLIKDLVSINSCKNNEYLFPDGGLSHLHPLSITSFLEKLKRDLNIKVLSTHRFRHYYATSLLKNGANLYEVSKLLGHSKIEMTKRYLDYSNNELKESNFKYNPLNEF